MAYLAATPDTFIAKKKADRTGKSFLITDKRGQHHWQINALTFMVQTDNPEIIYVIERNEFLKTEGAAPIHPEKYEQYRFGYWFLKKTDEKTSAWTWGQFGPQITVSDWPRLMAKAKKEGTLLN